MTIKDHLTGIGDSLIILGIFLFGHPFGWLVIAVIIKNIGE